MSKFDVLNLEKPINTQHHQYTKYTELPYTTNKNQLTTGTLKPTTSYSAFNATDIRYCVLFAGALHIH